MTEDKKEIKRKDFNRVFVLVGVVSVFLGCFLNGYDYKMINFYLDHKYQIINTTEHYAHNPLSDLTFRIPLLYDSDLRFPDFNESINIQTHGRLELQEKSLVNVVFDIEKGELQKYRDEKYSNDIMFLNNKLYENDVLYVNQQDPYCELFYTLRTVDSNDIPYFATQLLVDNVFVEEFRLYYPGSFFIIGSNDSYVLESQNSYKNDLVKDLLNGKKNDILINIYLIGSERYEFDLYNLIESDISPWLKGLDNLFNFKFRIHHLKSLEDNENFPQYTVDDIPQELTSLPWISDIMGMPKVTNYELKIVYYPYNECNQRIQNITIDGKPLYHSIENHNIEISGGVLYFTHIREDGNIERADDFIWVITKAILDTMGAPCHEIAFAVRVNSFKRVLIVDCLTRIGKLFGGIKEHFESSQAIYDLEIIELVSNVLNRRHSVIKLAKENELDQALVLALEILEEINSVLKRKQISE